jgi:mannitol/fructose-specific phosphotransferase system IIA component
VIPCKQKPKETLGSYFTFRQNSLQSNEIIREAVHTILTEGSVSQDYIAVLHA